MSHSLLLDSAPLLVFANAVTRTSNTSTSHSVVRCHYCHRHHFFLELQVSLARMDVQSSRVPAQPQQLMMQTSGRVTLSRRRSFQPLS
eukprot:4931735-Pleurochrysis_carterae.AAC.1